MTEATALKIALEALLELKDHSTNKDGAAVFMRSIAREAIREIQREHYLVEPSPVVGELLAGVKGL